MMAVRAGLPQPPFSSFAIWNPDVNRLHSCGDRNQVMEHTYKQHILITSPVQVSNSDCLQSNNLVNIDQPVKFCVISGCPYYGIIVCQHVAGGKKKYHTVALQISIIGRFLR